MRTQAGGRKSSGGHLEPLLTDSFSQSAFLCSEDHLPKGGITHSELGPTISIINH